MITKLSNGLTVCTQSMPGVETAALTLLADCGSQHEPAALNGMAHLYEHMVFKGAGTRSAREISEAIEDVGGELNACTERDATSFTASVMAEHVPLALELLADLIVRPHFNAEDLDREKQVVLQELAEAEDTPSDIIFDELWSAAFADQPLGRSILGSEASVNAISADDLRQWRDRHYSGDRLILSVAGKVDHDEVTAAAERLFSPLPSAVDPTGELASFTGGTRVGRTPSEQAHLTFAFEGPAIGTPQALPARLFADIVGGGASSRLFQEVREQRGLAYSVSASLQSYRETGIFYVHAATARRDGPAAAQLISDVIAAAASDITERELSRARNQARAGLLMNLETSWGRAGYAARQLATYGRVKSVDEVLAELDAVTLDQLGEAAADLLSGPMARATIGMPAARAA
ncbi:insulinase family protein [Sphingomonas piscis]|uniref:Insulinase family protein n=1 Tax=Sphingomonas piscis TaxID=2714943 RepID=A0A6G7YQC7_9SPHN|nr:pitrilysin family protein [Sphingomonas piscis]QIK78936.1 insulinase family protein [Sphingomonas piscis]